MSEKLRVMATVDFHEQIASDVYSLYLNVAEMANEVRAGQFVSVYCNEGSRLLPRPISICEAIPERGQLRLVYRVVGAGTRELSNLHAGSKVRVMGPLGNGYELLDKSAILIAGGIGIPPMLELAKRLSCKKTIVLGYRDEIFLNEEFEPYGDVVIASEDGQHGVKGNVMDAITANGVSGDAIYSCGPIPMLRAVKEYGLTNGITTQISLEERMACGIGACLACVCNSTAVDAHSNVHNKRVCKDGPVFYAEEVELS
jgi:dihydroorotate dehydrogenase electron transfer subunit